MPNIENIRAERGTLSVELHWSSSILVSTYLNGCVVGRELEDLFKGLLR